MKELFTAIYDRFTKYLNWFGLTALYNTQAPDDAIFPYATLTLLDVVPDWTFTENFKDCLVQFNFFSKKPLATEVCKAFTALKQLFDFHDLSIENYALISLVREVATLVRIEGVWQYKINYKLFLQKG